MCEAGAIALYQFELRNPLIAEKYAGSQLVPTGNDRPAFTVAATVGFPRPRTPPSGESEPQKENPVATNPAAYMPSRGCGRETAENQHYRALNPCDTKNKGPLSRRIFCLSNWFRGAFAFAPRDLGPRDPRSLCGNNPRRGPFGQSAEERGHVALMLSGPPA